jgi:S-methylmethionine-dependent homocysteine/selenocysteine methylase
VIIANTYAASRAALEPSGLGTRVAEANRSAVRAALRAREGAATRPVAGSMSSFSPIDMDPAAMGRSLAGPASEDPRFPSLADFREQAELLAEAGVDLIALEMIDAAGYGRAALQAAAETGLPVWLGISPARLDDGTLGTLPEEAITWADCGAQLIGGCCGVGPEHIRLLAKGLARRGAGA